MVNEDKIKEARAYIAKYTKSAHAVILDEAIKSASHSHHGSPNIEKLIEGAKANLAKILDEQMYISTGKLNLPLQLDFEQSIAWASQELDIKKHQCKNKMEAALDDLKVQMVRSIVEEGAPAKSIYEVVYLKINSGFIELQEGDIPISYQAYQSMFSSGSSSGTGGGGQELVREIIVLRPVPEGNVQH